MASILVALASSPETAAGRHGLMLAQSLVAAGHSLTLCCLQDAVLLASNHAPREARAVLDDLLDRGARCMTLLDDLALRGLEAGARAETVDHAGLIAVLTADRDRVVGAF